MGFLSERLKNEQNNNSSSFLNKMKKNSIESRKIGVLNLQPKQKDFFHNLTKKQGFFIKLRFFIGFCFFLRKTSKYYEEG